MSRYQWYQISKLDAKALRTLGQVLLKDQFDSRKRSGFKIEEVRPSHIHGKFIEKYEFTQTIEDPLGNKFDLKQLSFETVEFSISDEKPHLECRNAGRNLRDFKNELAKALNYEVAITRLSFDLDTFVRSLAKRATKVMLTKAVANDIMMDEGVFAQLHVTSTRDVRESIKTFLKKIKYSLTKVRIFALIDDTEVTIEVSASGSLSVNGHLSSKGEALLRATVMECGKTQ